jgi:hypothetical protein
MNSWEKAVAISLTCAFGLVLGKAVWAQGYNFGKVYWESNGVPLCAAPGVQGMPHVSTDSNHGLIATWTDCRSSTTNCDIYAQRVQADGNLSWQLNGVPVSIAPDNQLGPRVVDDDAGGVFIAWSDFRNHTDYSVYAQRLDSAGNQLWNSDGVTITAKAGHQIVLDLVPDGLGGAFIVWEESQSPSGMDINLFAQHIGSQGTLFWSVPITITAAPNDQYYGDSSPDGLGGILVTWSDVRNADDPNIYAQHLSAGGTVLWQQDGVLVSSDPALQRPGYIVSDCAGGAYIAWYDFRPNHNLADAYMQRLTISGTLAWSSDLPVIADFDYAEGPNSLISDGNGGAILIASRYIEGAAETDILAQRVSNTGELLWGPEAVNVTPWEMQQDLAVAVQDNAGGVYVAWIDKYTDGCAYDIWTQHLGTGGERLWPGHGVQAVGIAGSQGRPAIISDDANGMIVAWQDFRNDPDDPDLYAQRIGDGAIMTRRFLPLVLKNG